MTLVAAPVSDGRPRAPARGCARCPDRPARGRSRQAGSPAQRSATPRWQPRRRCMAMPSRSQGRSHPRPCGRAGLGSGRPRRSGCAGRTRPPAPSGLRRSALPGDARATRRVEPRLASSVCPWTMSPMREGPRPGRRVGRARSRPSRARAAPRRPRTRACRGGEAPGREQDDPGLRRAVRCADAGRVRPGGVAEDAVTPLEPAQPSPTAIPSPVTSRPTTAGQAGSGVMVPPEGSISRSVGFTATARARTTTSEVGTCGPGGGSDAERGAPGQQPAGDVVALAPVPARARTSVAWAQEPGP